MHQVKERLAYLKGLAEGLDIERASAEGRVLAGIMDVMGEIVTSLERLTARHDQLEEYVESIDEDLSDLEDDLYEAYDEDLELSDDDEVGLENEDGDADLDDSAIEYMEMTCPNCKENVYVDEDVFDNDETVEVLCPECHETVLVNDQSGDEFAVDV
jgi:DNA-directed RNA polymerase subunit delta